MGDTKRLTFKKNKNNSVSAFNRRTGILYSEESQDKLYSALKTTFDCNKIRKRKNQLIVFTDGKKVET